MEAAETKSTVYMSSRHQNPGALSAQVKKENFTWAAVVGIFALVFAIAAVLFEYMDWSVISIG